MGTWSMVKEIILLKILQEIFLLYFTSELTVPRKQKEEMPAKSEHQEERDQRAIESERERERERREKQYPRAPLQDLRISGPWSPFTYKL